LRLGRDYFRRGYFDTGSCGKNTMNKLNN